MSIATLEAYVEQKNRWNAILGRKPVSLLNAKDRQAIADSIDADLSPENLSCDGELRGEALKHKYRQLTRAAQDLMSIDPTVKFYEFS
jgi:hypothetical protein